MHTYDALHVQVPLKVTHSLLLDARLSIFLADAHDSQTRGEAEFWNREQLALNGLKHEFAVERTVS